MTASNVIPLFNVASRPHSFARAAIARRVFEHAADQVLVQVRYPDGRVIGGGRWGYPVMELVRPAAFFNRLGRDANIGFGEAYMAGDWRPGAGTDLAELLAPFAERMSALVPPALQRLRALAMRPTPDDQRNTIPGARSNIAAHYDLGNDMFRAFLDPTMSYSSALFTDPHAPARGLPPDALEQAQLRKIDRALDLAGVGRESRVLEIGTGWGALAVRAAERGATVTTITLSKEQASLAEERAAAAGVANRVHVQLADYREVDGEYDAIVSIEMIEAVGEAYWPAYFRALDRLLAPDGSIALQAITMSHDRMLATRRNYSWIQKYIFPGGVIPSITAIEENLAAHTALHVTQRDEMGAHYALTLKLWRDNFLRQWPALHAAGYDETFRRMWEFYLGYCEAGFRSGYLGVSQLQLRRSA
jgi:cyclopropane-fatty-acyl-phospholipid synthase